MALAAAVLQLGENCVSLQDSICGPAVRIAEDTAVRGEQLVLACASGQNATCNLVTDLADAGVAAVIGCANGTNTTCAAAKILALELVDSGLALVTGCVAQNDSTCGPAVRTAVATLNLAVQTAQQCVSGQNTTCAEAEAAAQDILAGVMFCATGGIGPVPTTGVMLSTRVAVDVFGACVEARDLAASVVFTAVFAAQGCAQMNDAVCGPTVQQAEQTAEQIIVLAQQCAAGINPTCKTVLDAVAGAVFDVGQCISQFVTLSAASSASAGSAPAASVDLPAACASAKATIGSVVQTVVDAVGNTVRDVGACASQFVTASAATTASTTAATVAVDVPAACAEAKALLDALVQNVINDVLNLVADGNACAAQFVAPPVSISAASPIDLPGTCAIAKALIDELVQAVVQKVTQCAALNDDTCGPTVRLVEDTINAVLVLVQACAAGSDPICRLVQDTAKQITDAVANLAASCQAGLDVDNGSACALARGAVQYLVLTATCSAGSAGPCAPGSPPWCAVVDCPTLYGVLATLQGIIYAQVDQLYPNYCANAVLTSLQKATKALSDAIDATNAGQVADLVAVVDALQEVLALAVDPGTLPADAVEVLGSADGATLELPAGGAIGGLLANLPSPQQVAQQVYFQWVAVRNIIEAARGGAPVPIGQPTGLYHYIDCTLVTGQPNAPARLTASATTGTDKARITLKWPASESNGLDVTSYTIENANGNPVSCFGKSPCVVAADARGTYPRSTV